MTGSGDTNPTPDDVEDVVDRAKMAMQFNGPSAAVMRAALLAYLVPELVAEVESLRDRLGLLQIAGVEEFAALQVLQQRDRDAVAAELKRLEER